jgi:hypothetical protein
MNNAIKTNEKCLNSNAIKIIAIIAMTIDHVATIVFPRYSMGIGVIFLHLIVRLTAPIMMFFIVEGYFHTHSLKRYIVRLLIFTVISHFAYDFCFGKSFIPFHQAVFDQTSIIWPLLLGLVALWAHKMKGIELKSWQTHVIEGICAVLAFPADWSSPCVFAILYMGLNYGNFKRQMIALVSSISVYAVVYAIFLNVVYGILQMGVAFAIPILAQYNGKRGRWKGMKWFFYIYYPLHLVIIGLIRIFVLQKGLIAN